VLNPLVGTVVLEVVGRAHLISLFGSTGTVLVLDGNHLFALDLVQQGRENAPGLGQLIRADEVHLHAAENVQQQSLVGIGHLDVLVAAVVAEVQLRLLHVKTHAGRLGHQLHVDGLAGLHPHHQLVALWFAVENVTGHVLELDAHFRLPLVQCWNRKFEICKKIGMTANCTLLYILAFLNNSKLLI
jgi:hypothetical protein